MVVMLLLAALLLMLASLLDRHGRGSPWARLIAPEEDGSWAAVRIDGRPVSPDEYRVSITEGQVAGGRDGCNDWAFSDDPPSRDGARMIVATAQYCPGDDPTRRAYRALMSGAEVRLQADRTLRISAGGHEGIFRRCHWENVRRSGPGYSSEHMMCIVR